MSQSGYQMPVGLALIANIFRPDMLHPSRLQHMLVNVLLQAADQAASVLRASPGALLAVATSAGYLLCFRYTKQLSTAPDALLVRELDL